MSPAGRTIPVAIQLYSLRSVAPQDVEGTLRRVAELGYAGVEFAGYYNRPAAELKVLLEACGLRCAGAHVGLDALEGAAFAQTIEINRTLGNDRLIVPGADLKDLETTIRRLNAAHERARAEGMRLGFHNHTKEFELVDGVSKFDRIFGATPDDFLVQLDIGWATAAGQDVPAILRRYGPRLETVHVKEFSPGRPSATVGDGTVDWASVFNVIERETAVVWYVVEQEQYVEGPLESARDCLAHIRRLGR